MSRTRPRIPPFYERFLIGTVLGIVMSRHPRGAQLLADAHASFADDVHPPHCQLCNHHHYGPRCPEVTA
jgi:hypothetical protein